MTINEYDVVALTESISATHTGTQQAIELCRGQVGTVLTKFGNEAFLIDFADNEGQTYAMETVPIKKIMLLLHDPVMAAA